MTLKARVIPTMLHKDVGLVKGVGFDSWRRVGSAMQAVKVYNLRDVDELVLLDITATRDGRGPDLELVDELADECFMPLTVGGGVRGVDDVHALMDVGADRVALNTAAIEEPKIVSAIANRFGVQSVLVSIDARRHPDGMLEVFTHCGTVATGRDPVSIARILADAGAGELIVTSIDKDGTMDGYDLGLLSSVSNAVAIPVIGSGGAGKYEDLVRAVKEAGVAAVAAASMFHFTQATPIEAREHMRASGIPVRRQGPFTE